MAMVQFANWLQWIQAAFAEIPSVCDMACAGNRKRHQLAELVRGRGEEEKERRLCRAVSVSCPLSLKSTDKTIY
jgi:hypothetical protein